MKVSYLVLAGFLALTLCGCQRFQLTVIHDQSYTQIFKVDTFTGDTWFWVTPEGDHSGYWFKMEKKQ